MSEHDGDQEVLRRDDIGPLVADRIGNGGPNARLGCQVDDGIEVALPGSSTNRGIGVGIRQISFNQCETFGT